MDEVFVEENEVRRKLKKEEKDRIVDELEGHIEKEKIKRKVDKKYKEFCKNGKIFPY